jgi:hypothetical protein
MLIKFDNIIRKELLKRSGIYIIKNDINEKVYIGSAKDFYNRLMQHKNSLINKYSKNIKLLRFVNKYGIDKLFVELIDIVKSRNELYDIEKEYIIKYNSVENGYNCSYETKVSQIPFTEERKKKIGKKSKGRIFSNESKLRRSIQRKGKFEYSGENNNNLAKLTNEEVILIKKMLLLGYRPNDIIKLYKNVKVNTIYNIKENIRWQFINVKKEDIIRKDKNNIKNIFKDILKDNENKLVRSDSKLSINKVKFIRYLLNNTDNIKETNKRIRLFYNITYANLSRIYLNKIYKELESELIVEEFKKWNRYFSD